MKFSKVLVTGGAGFIPSYIVDELVKRGYNVRIFDNLDQQVHGRKKPDYFNTEAEFVEGDIRNPEDIIKALEGVDAVFHQAAAVGVGQSMYEIERYVDVNTLGTAKLLDILANKEHDVRKLIVASSMSIYGEGKYNCADCGDVYPVLRPEEQLKNREWEMKCPECGKPVTPVPTSEDKPLRSTSIYAISKKDQEEMSLVVGKAYGIPTIALRYFNVYGPRQSLSNPYTGVCAIFSSRIRNGNPPVIYEDGRQTRDFVHISDIVQANMLALESGSGYYEAYNVGTGKGTSILGVAEELIKIYGADVTPVIEGKYRFGDIRHCYADLTKIKSKLGYEPKIDISEGFKELIGWVTKQECEDNFEKAKAELEKRNLTL